MNSVKVLIMASPNQGKSTVAQILYNALSDLGIHVNLVDLYESPIEPFELSI